MILVGFVLIMFLAFSIAEAPRMPVGKNERPRTERIGWLRAAVLGANDGILSTSSLVLGVAASHATHNSIVVAGVAGLVRRNSRNVLGCVSYGPNCVCRIAVRSSCRAITPGKSTYRTVDQTGRTVSVRQKV